MTDSIETAPLITIDEVTKSFGSNIVLRGISLDVGRGEVVGILGPSGSGKSTLLRCINHLEEIDSGEVRVDGVLVGYREHKGRLWELRPNEVAKRREGIGMVFQRFNLFPHMTALENVMEAPVRVLRRRKSEVRTEALALLDSVGLGHRVDAYPGQLSGGQQQRVAIARALAMKPQLILFDEPTSALDPELVGEVLAVMRRLADDGMTMIVVTHEIAFARDVCDRVVFMADGLVVEQGPARSLIENPQHERTKTFLARVLG